MEKNAVLASFKNLEANGRKLVSVVRIRPLAWWMGARSLDLTDFSSPRIWAIIPGWMDEKGEITSLRTGEVVKVGRYDDVRSEGVGDAFDYEDGTKIIRTRGWKDGKWGEFFAVRECRDCECVHHRAFGESLREDPLARKFRR